VLDGSSGCMPAACWGVTRTETKRDHPRREVARRVRMCSRRPSGN
jgi:hypothetical protein